MPQRFRSCWTTCLARARPNDAKTVHRRKALSKAIRRTFGSAVAIQRCQIHKARNVIERLPKEHHPANRRMLRQAW
ncbi:transposase-like protein [Bradyrhizobium sp. LM2.7]